MEGKKYEIKKLSPKQVGEIIAEYFQKDGCEVGEINVQMQHGLFIGVNVEIEKS